MNLAQRIILITYCILIAYCSLWIPWRLKLRVPEGAHERVGYGWVWAGPYRSAPIVYDPPIRLSNGTEILGEEDLRSSWTDLTAEPDFALLVLRFLAATALSSTAFLSAGLLRRGLRGKIAA